MNAHPFSHLPAFYELANPISENALMRKGWNRDAVEALPDKDLTALMKAHGASAEWMQYLSQARILSLLQSRYETFMTYSFHPVEERIRRRLGCLILRERLLPSPFYKQRDDTAGETFWITFQSGAYNE